MTTSNVHLFCQEICDNEFEKCMLQRCSKVKEQVRCIAFVSAASPIKSSHQCPQHQQAGCCPLARRDVIDVGECVVQDRESCKGEANMMSSGVRMFGCGAYESSQQEACSCELDADDKVQVYRRPVSVPNAKSLNIV
jgi:hypothetical protein